MASKNINVLMSLQDYFSNPMRKIGKTTEETEKKFKRVKNAISNFGDTANSAFKKISVSVAKCGAAIAGVAISGAVVGLKAMATESVAAAEKQIQAETQLEAVLKNVTSIQERGAGATKKAADNLKAYASELQSVGVIGDEVTLAGMAQLATFQMNDEQIKTVSASMLDLLAKTKGYKATQEDAVAAANMIGKAMTGQATALSRVGITMSEEEQRAIKFGDANQRAAVIAKVLQNNVGGVNKAMAATDMGRKTQAMNDYGDMLEEFGKKLLPINAALWSAFREVLPQVQSSVMPALDMLADAFKGALPDIKKLIVMLAQILPDAISAVITIIKTAVPVIKKLYDWLVLLAPVIAGVAAGFAAFNVVKSVIAIFQTLTQIIGIARHAVLLFNLAVSMNPLGLVCLAVAALVALLVILYQNWDRIVAFFMPTIEKVKKAFTDLGASIKTNVLSVWDSIQTSFTNCVNYLKRKWQEFADAISHPIDTIVRTRKEQMKEEGYATGTSYFAGGMARVNEGGRGELINLPSGSQIIPNSLSRAALAGSGGQTFNISLNVAGNVIGNDDFYNECGRVITERITLALGNM